jgi:serine/threonine protein kinase
MLQNRILEKPQMKKYFNAESKSLLSGLLEPNPSKRLTVEQIKSHEFFKEIDWSQVSQRTNKVEFVPKVSSSTDLKNISTEFTREDIEETYVDKK